MHFQGQKVKGELAGGGAYCGGLPHSFYYAPLLIGGGIKR